MDSFKRMVDLKDVRPNDSNPRQDMGDLKALAASIEATGGQPIQPIIVVVDGDVYRIVDGERRFRAMELLGKTSCDAMVFRDYGEASQMVAMLATDDKRPLTEAERARGFQQMLRLDVPEDVGSKVMGCDVAGYRKARRAAKSAPEQASFSDMLVAGDEDFTDEERQRILSHSRWETAEQVAAKVRKERKVAEKLAAIRAELPSVGEWFDREEPWNARREGLVPCGIAKSPKEARDLEAELAGQGDLVAYRSREKRNAWAVFQRSEEGALDPREVERREIRERVDRAEAAWAAAMEDLFAFLVLHLWDGSLHGFGAMTADKRAVGRHVDKALDAGLIATPILDRARGSFPSPWGLLGRACLVADFGSRLTSWDGKPNERAEAAFREAYEALMSDGWEPDGPTRALYVECGGEA